MFSKIGKSTCALVISMFILMGYWGNIVSVNAADLHFAIGNRQPQYIIDGDEISGACGEIYNKLRYELELLNVSVDYENNFSSEDDILRQLRLGQLDVFCAEEQNTQLKADYIYSIRPVFQLSEILVKGDRDMQILQNHDDFRHANQEIIVLRDSSSAKFLSLLEGIVVNDNYTDVEDILDLVAEPNTNRVFYHTDIDVVYSLKRKPRSVYIGSIKYRNIQYWLLYSRDANSVNIEKLEKILLRLELEGELKKIQEKYTKIP